ncbi:Endo-1,4-beta-xylanase A precursor [Planctomycetes bacterium CA13]|uniref:Beta-xylanase n=1 Tax=Novipirellula herctigrandis TaxID=2527986 RepID=A0A5C5Z3Y3_9BACT|nr:Endo-1,4-beta-xylanase A precursor [Planctomycetes bacterium CA13]
MTTTHNAVMWWVLVLISSNFLLQAAETTKAFDDSSTGTVNEQVLNDASLKNTVGSRFKIGVGVSHQVIENPDDAALITRHFEILTPENCMKPQAVHPGENVWNFENADRFADFTRKRKLELVGHCLVWAKDDRTDQWMMQEDGEPVSRDILLHRIETHVDTVVGRYADVATMWDVVNEAIGDSDGDLLRDSIYSRTTGMDFIVTAFKAAHAKDPDALLIYNDYNCHKPGKREKLIKLLTELKKKGAPVDAYGMQGHFELGDDSIPQLRETFAELRKLGIKVVVSELDIDVVKRGRWWAEDGKYREELATYDPYKDGLPEDIQRKLTQQYVEIFQLFSENSDVIERVSFWNLHDGESWLNDFPWKRVNYPLLFDRDRQPKPAFFAVCEALSNRNATRKKPSKTHAAWERTDEMSQLAHAELLKKTKQGTVDIYFQGDSITRRWGATDYPKLLAHWKKSFHGWNAANFAWGGDNTHHILWRMQNGELDGVAPKVIVLQAGANNLPWTDAGTPGHVDDVTEGIQAIIAEFRSRFPETPIVMTAMFPRDQNIKLIDTIDAINKRLETIATADKTIHWVNINKHLLGADGKLLPQVSSDGIHLEEPGYELWAQALRPIFTKLLGPPETTDTSPPPTGIPKASSATSDDTGLKPPLKPRVVVLTDVSTWETDDSESLVRLLVHADMIEIEGLVFTTGWSLDKTRDDFMGLIHKATDAYEKDLPNLRKRSNQPKHRQDESRQNLGYWPSPQYLRERTMYGSRKRGAEHIGEGNDSPGSNLIIKLADEDDNRPVWVTVWGGGNTLAQAIWRVKQDRTAAELKTFLKKLRVYTITDQDRGQKTPFSDSSHQWLRKEFESDLFFIWDECAWKYQNGTGKKNWTQYESHIQNHGNLGRVYPKYKYGVEGDTPAILHVMPTGLNNPSEPTQGGWGGYFAFGTAPDQETSCFTNHQGAQYETCRELEDHFYAATFNNFAARMDWAKDGAGNRNPIAAIDNDKTLKILTRSPREGTTVKLDASTSQDPDDDKMTFKWWVLTAAGTYTQEIKITGSDSKVAAIEVPPGSAGKTFHVICEVTDDGTHNLTSYRRIIFEPTK